MAHQFLVRLAPWSLGLLVCLLSIFAWADDLQWQLTPLNAYVIFPVLGLTAYGLMWSMYVLGALREIFKLDESSFSDYFKTAGWAVLILICLHPGLLIYQRFRDGFGLPPGSYESYVAPGLGWVTLLGTASLLVFLAYEFHRLYGERRWWRYVQTAVDLAMLAIFYHGLRLGTQTGHGWFHMVWWFYGITLVAVLTRSYFLKYKQYRHR
jgi:hypothetical protein